MSERERVFHPVHGELLNLDEVSALRVVSFGAPPLEHAQLLLPAIDMKRLLHTVAAGVDEGDALRELKLIREALRPLATGKFGHLHREGEDVRGFVERLAAELVAGE